MPSFPPRKHTPSVFLSDIMVLLSVILGITGVLFVLFAYLSRNKADPLNDFASNAFLNFGSGMLTAGIVAFVVDRFSKRINIRDQEELIRKTIDQVNASFEALKIQNRVQGLEVQSTILVDNVIRDVLSGGIISAQSESDRLVDRAWIESQNELYIVFRDGAQYIQRYGDAIKTRIIKKRKTKIIMVHPSYNGISLISTMDPAKRDSQEQLEACLATIKFFHHLRDSIKKERGLDCSNWVDFIGYRMIPVWFGFVGSDMAYIYLLYTRPYRSNLNRLCVSARSGRVGHQMDWYNNYKHDCDEIIRLSKASNDHSLWEFQS